MCTSQTLMDMCTSQTLNRKYLLQALVDISICIYSKGRGLADKYAILNLAGSTWTATSSLRPECYTLAVKMKNVYPNKQTNIIYIRISQRIDPPRPGDSERQTCSHTVHPDRPL